MKLVLPWFGRPAAAAPACLPCADLPGSTAPGSYSIVGRLCRQLMWQTLIGMGLLCGAIYAATVMFVESEQRDQLALKTYFIQELMRAGALKGGEAEVVHKLALYAPRRPNTFLEVWRADGSLLYRDGPDNGSPGKHWRSIDFETTLPQGAGSVTGRFAEDCSQNARMLAGLGLTLMVATLAGAAFVGFGTTWRVRRGLQPLQGLARQTQAIAPDRLGDRLHLKEPVEELQPWIDQFNGLMERLQGAYVQLEGFNADVAHELRTPLANVIGQTEVALSRERSPEALRETLTSNLEEMQRLAALVNDMLFLSQSDRGAVARRGAAVSLAALAEQVVEFHEAPLEEAGLTVQIEGGVSMAVDEPLFKRAVSNLLGNAIRFAEPGSRIVIRIANEGEQQVRVEVQNAGPAIAPQHLARLFDRFFRVESARSDSQSHHGLGLAIVAAIARMHAGRPVAASDDAGTRVGFTLAAR
ncbi:two-component system, OmpR family, heavy metal sensor histidine kinase CusS [Rhodocyclaceae bacterium]|nr:two-component system, OmpR family, heavy metal sensor histidine kinase CusS [Rhodocyclaceae bacterium]